MRKRENIIFMLLFAVSLCVVFRDILFLKAAFLNGDYLQQLFPWSAIYSEGIKHFKLSTWITDVQCGFPLFAEGQIGQLYPLNIAVFLLLPLKAAYNYSFLIHYFLSGIFTYFYARKKGADAWGGAIAALLVCFGSAYAGCFIHLASLRALAWFPLVLLLYDDYLEGGGWWRLALTGGIAGFQLLAGSMQMAVYALFFYAIYFLYRAFQEKHSIVQGMRDIMVLWVAAFLIASPQIAETFILSGYSNRLSLMTKDFALWNSLSPLALAGTIMPYLGKILSKGNVVYIGVLGLFFALIGIWRSAGERRVRPLVLMAAAALFMALGKYNPLYVIMLKATGFYSFRAPSRFIYFGIFSLAVLAGTGFTYFVSNKDKVPPAVYGIFRTILALVVGGFLAACAVIEIWGAQILSAAKEYVAGNIYGKPFHRYDLDTYMERTEALFDSIRSAFSLTDPIILTTIVFILFAAVFVHVLKNARAISISTRAACLIFVCTELTFFSLFSRGIRPEIAAFETIEPGEKRIFDTITGDDGLFRVCPFGEFRDIPLWLRPSMNAYYGIDSISIYSPLTNKDYFDIMKGLGTVDDSIGIISPDKDVLYGRIDLLRELNVKYIVSAMDLEHPGLEYVMKEEGLRLYVVKDYLPRFRFSPDAFGVAGEADMTVKEYVPGRLETHIDAQVPGDFIFAEKYYPEWEAYVDGEKADIIRVSEILQSVKLVPGAHKIVFRYRPRQLERYLPVFSGTVLVIFCLVIYGSRRRRNDHL